MVRTNNDFMGFSDSCFEDALKNALQSAGHPILFEIIESSGSLVHENKPYYQITITAFFD